jgi:phage head maturation protease
MAGKRIEEDEKGLRYEIDLPDTQTGRDVAHLVDRGDLTGSSFGFVVEQESWRETEEEDGSRLAVRTIESVRLLDVGPVTYPAYSSTSAGRSAQSVRALGSVEEARDSYKRWKEKQREELPLAAKLAQVRARAVQVAG